MHDVEDLYHGKGRQTGVTDLRDGRKLPIWFDAWNTYLKKFQTGLVLDSGGVTTEFHMCIAIREYWCTADELGATEIHRAVRAAP